MKLPVKILAVQIAVPLLIALGYFATDKFDWQTFFGTYGIIAIPVALVNILGAIIMAIANYQKNKAWILGLVTSAVVLFITGFFAVTQLDFGR